MAKKKIKLTEKDLSKLIQHKISEMYDDPIIKNKIELELKDNIDASRDVLIEGYEHLTNILNVLHKNFDTKRINSLVKIMDQLYYAIEALNDFNNQDIDYSMGIKGLNENATIDAILDKMSKKEPLTNREKMALDMASKGENVDDDFVAKKGLEVKSDGDVELTYTHNKTEDRGENKRYYGTLELNGSNYFKPGAEVKTTVYMSPDDIGEEIPEGTTGIVNSIPKDSEELVAVLFDSTLHYLPQDVLEVVNGNFTFKGFVESTPYGELENYKFTDYNGNTLDEVIGNDKTELNKFLWKVIDEIMFNEEN